jgi:hypothetical protein
MSRAAEADRGLSAAEPRPNPRDDLLRASLLLALLGFWMPWLDHPAAALRLNAYELSEWVTFLPAVRAGELAVSRLAFLVPSACLAVLMAIASARTRAGHTRHWRDALRPRALAGWGLLALAGLCVTAVFPYYPYILSAYADPEFQTQFFVACAAVLGIVVVFALPEDVNALLEIGLALLGLGMSVWTLSALQPVASQLLGQVWVLGWGWAAALLGFTGIVIAAWRQLFEPR